ncbi:hypothetical protein BGX33_006851 [Mortierella sp. NVP41]|nr:hypothetical protein BGX33_006851 [Mortierella sp. NVP41]
MKFTTVAASIALVLALSATSMAQSTNGTSSVAPTGTANGTATAKPTVTGNSTTSPGASPTVPKSGANTIGSNAMVAAAGLAAALAMIV